jgi:hypothetical protein
MIDAPAFERKAINCTEGEMPAWREPEKWEPIRNATVVGALAGNGDGVLAGALGDLTARLVALLLVGLSIKR